MTVLTTRKTKEQLRPEGVDPKVKIFDYSYGRVRVLENGAVDSFGFSLQSYRAWWQKLAVKIKRSLINPYLGQIADPNLLSVILTIVSFWLRKKLGSKSSQIDFANATIISTAPPWSMHLLGAALSHLFNCPLIIDYRDQFSNSHMFGGYLRSLEYKIDSFLCRRAQKVITISPSMTSICKPNSVLTFATKLTPLLAERIAEVAKAKVRSTWNASIVCKCFFSASNPL